MFLLLTVTQIQAGALLKFSQNWFIAIGAT